MLIDAHGRRIDYLRLSVTDRCDLRCRYCMPAGYRGFCGWDDLLSADDIVRIGAAFARLGVSHLRLTGGEPLVRNDIVDIARRLARLPGIEDLSLSTNGTRLAELAVPLRLAGVMRVNVSLDTLRSDRFAAITGARVDALNAVLAGIDAAAAAGMTPIKLNTVVMRGFNDDELTDMVEYCVARGLSIRFIETMPMGASGQTAFAQYLDLDEVRQRLEREFNLLPDVMPGGGPARYWRVADSETRVGFITPISRHFCDTCNRLRVGADGMLYPCLGDIASRSMRPALDGNDDQLLESMIHQALEAKPLRHRFDAAAGRPLRAMAHTGG
ncbi:GTP 3',8-cyclase MoaA [Sulfurivermis fontis]|uniref:GTP 3',8-cyclase MoaA n=1 Tax=Sulfurivermis fontis TaxID=1972068 RepID=UPI000FDBC4A3|nr:GTP 3',8-cyclase MoaA [Sulfurivermis fontis]